MERKEKRKKEKMEIKKYKSGGKKEKVVGIIVVGTI